MSLVNHVYTPTQISSSHAVELTNVRRIFGKRAVLDGIDLTIRPAEFVAVLGPSGTGKTTLLRLLSGLDRSDGGSVRVAANRAVVFQEPRLILAKRAWENVVLGHKGRGARRDAVQALEEVGLRNHVDCDLNDNLAKRSRNTSEAFRTRYTSYLRYEL